MNVPGSNLLTQALQLITSQSISYYAYLSRSKTATGTFVPVYARAVVIKGSIQPVSRSLMQILGLDMQRNYVNIFVRNAVIDIKRDVSSDKFMFAGTTYQALSITKWISVDSWNQVLAIEVPS